MKMNEYQIELLSLWKTENSHYSPSSEHISKITLVIEDKTTEVLNIKVWALVGTLQKNLTFRLPRY